MTEVYGLRLAYRGFVTGLAGGWVWAAIAMALSGVATGDPLLALRPFALALTPLATHSELAFVLGLLVVQLGAGLIGLLFAYFFARFFTVRGTLALAGPAVAILAWGLVAAAFTRETDAVTFARNVAPLLATLGYGVLLAAGIPLRGDVTRYSGSPST